MSCFLKFYTFKLCFCCSTCFLMGPLNQCKKMFSPTRVVATVLVFVCLVLTLLSAFLVSIFAPLISWKCIALSGFSLLVEKEWACSVVLHYSVSGHDMVFIIVYSIRPRCSEENCFYVYGIKANMQKEKYTLLITYVHLLHKICLPPESNVYNSCDPITLCLLHLLSVPFYHIILQTLWMTNLHNLHPPLSQNVQINCSYYCLLLFLFHKT